MALKFIAISAVSTVLSFVGLQFCTDLSLEKLKSDGLIGWNSIHLDNVDHDIELPLGLYTTIVLLTNCMINVFVLLNLCLKAMFFSELYPSETRKLIERLVNYVIYKGTFLPLVVLPTLYQAGLWSTWLAVLCSLKMFQALARDRLERLNASPSATPWTYLRVYSALLFIFLVDVLWIRLCLEIYSTHGSSMFLLLFFEPLSIAFETLQAILVHGFQLLDIWIHHSACSGSDFRTHKLLDALTAGSLLEWKGILIRNLGFFLDMATFFMALGHYLYIWRLHGMAFHLVDAVLFLNIRALLSAMINRIKGFIRLRIALGALHAALPDATTEELRGYEDECAICREPMAKAKKLNCNHLFHLACLRSWLDQGLTEMYTCPTCRKPLFAGRPENETNSSTGVISSDEQLARQMSAGFDRQNSARHNMPAGLFPNPTLNNAEGVPWRSAGLDSGWLHSWPNQGVDGAGPSTAIRTVGLGRVQMMMRHLASVGETYAQTTFDDASWNLWPINPSQTSASGPSQPTAPSPGVRLPGGNGGLHIRTASRSANDNLANVLAMAETVREVLPHIPDDIIFQDLQRTNSVTVTVNNLLQM
ncbi:putative chromatin regulator PHD family [Medicago truncatula]|uniref:RING-type E3 ubiquitin transferase n=1 Tax=Medicago truncatula TaxID=3880 RepID=G7IVC2_MEDTR|nr:E3 ubiquitin protein ligase RIN2 [Medicago truncatula]AES68395.1 E3 ubiquitin protein ligase RIN2 [Medicago truncatula]RHN65324.1 putative chromatin regulator PHD family [Medicago truncatula]